MKLTLVLLVAALASLGLMMALSGGPTAAKIAEPAPAGPAGPPPLDLAQPKKTSTATFAMG